MPQSDTNSHRLVPLEGELPPSGNSAITVFLCCHRSELEQGLLPALLRINQNHLSNPVHCHILDLDAAGLAHLNLFGKPVTPMTKTTFYFVIGVLVLTAVTPTAQSMLYEVSGTPLFSMTHPIGWTIFAERDGELAARRQCAEPSPA